MEILPHEKLISEEELTRLISEEKWFEIIDGEVIYMSPNVYIHNVIVANIYDILRDYLRKNKIGRVLADGLIHVLRVHEKGVRDVRIPDLSFVRKERIPKGFSRYQPFMGAPDLAVEVVSPNEGASELRDKIVDYLGEGTEQVWVAYPNRKEIHVYTGLKGENVRIYTEKDILEAEALFPGLKINIGDCFLDEFED